MKRNIYSILLSFIALVAMTASCTKFLTEEPKTFDTPQVYYNTAEEMQYSVNGCYGGLSSVFASGIGLALNHTKTSASLRFSDAHKISRKYAGPR